jgi:hypothetical protein
VRAFEITDEADLQAQKNLEERQRAKVTTQAQLIKEQLQQKASRVM